MGIGCELVGDQFKNIEAISVIKTSENRGYLEDGDYCL